MIVYKAEYGARRKRTGRVLARWLGVSGKVIYDLAKAGVIERAAGGLYPANAPNWPHAAPLDLSWRRFPKARRTDQLVGPKRP